MISLCYSKKLFGSNHHLFHPVCHYSVNQLCTDLWIAKRDCTLLQAPHCLSWRGCQILILLLVIESIILFGIVFIPSSSSWPAIAGLATKVIPRLLGLLLTLLTLSPYCTCIKWLHSIKIHWLLVNVCSTFSFEKQKFHNGFLLSTYLQKDKTILKEDCG